MQWLRQAIHSKQILTLLVFLSSSVGAAPTLLPMIGIVGSNKVQPVTVLGSATANSSPLTYTLTKSVGVGKKVVLVITTTERFDIDTLVDSKSNTWTAIAAEPSSTDRGGALIYLSTLTTALAAGDTITATFSGSGGALGYTIWAAVLDKYIYPEYGDGYANTSNTTTPSVSTSGSVGSSTELLIGAHSASRCTLPTSFTQPAGWTEAVDSAFQKAQVSVGYKVGTGLSGVQSYSATSTQSCRWSSVIATFRAGPVTAPSGLTLSHTTRAKSFTVGWTAGVGNGGPGGCTIQYQNNGGSWVNLSTVNCDQSTSGLSVTLPTDGWYGATWSSVAVRIKRNSDNSVMGTFGTNLTCSTTSGSASSTPSIDEDCDNNWNDHTCSTWTWVQGTVYNSTFTACTNTTTYATKACDLSAEGLNLYTDGTSTTPSPASRWSSTAFGTGCTGSFTGAVQWTCTGSSCTYY